MMLFLVAIAHGIVILGLTFGAPGRDGRRAPGLEVMLVSDELPTADRNDKAAYLAQRTQIGSGTGEDVRRATSPAAVRERRAREGRRDGVDADTRPEADSATDRTIFTTARRMTVRYFAPVFDAAVAGAQPLLVEDERRGAQALGPDASSRAEIKGAPRDELVIAPDTRESILAPYLDSWRRKVERLGTMNFPTAAKRPRALANPVLEVAIASSGKLESAVVRRSSGQPELDQSALDILKLASPFDPFPKEVAAHYRVLRFAYEWQFEGSENANGAQGRVLAPAEGP